MNWMDVFRIAASTTGIIGLLGLIAAFWTFLATQAKTNPESLKKQLGIDYPTLAAADIVKIVKCMGADPQRRFDTVTAILAYHNTNSRDAASAIKNIDLISLDQERNRGRTYSLFFAGGILLMLGLLGWLATVFAPVPLPPLPTPSDQGLILMLQGVAHLQGIGVARNDDEAYKFLHQAADQGNGRAYAELAMMYRAGRVKNMPQTDANDKQAATWLETGALSGDARAMAEYGNFHRHLIGVPNDGKNANTAISWWMKAAAKRDELGMYYLGEAYETGLGDYKMDLQQAADWYNKSYQLGCYPALEASKRVAGN